MYQTHCEKWQWECSSLGVPTLQLDTCTKLHIDQGEVLIHSSETYCSSSLHVHGEGFILQQDNNNVMAFPQVT